MKIKEKTEGNNHDPVVEFYSAAFFSSSILESIQFI